MHAELVNLERSQFVALNDAESKLRIEYLSVDDDRIEDLPGTVTRSAGFLEVMLITACTLEVSEELGVRSRDERTKRVREIGRKVQERCGLDPFKIVSDAHASGILPPLSSRQTAEVNVALKAIVRAVRSILEVCPIGILEIEGQQIGLESDTHRCRVAYEGLRTFVRRQSSSDIDLQRVRVGGQLYTEGRAQLDEVAALLGVSPSDAVWLLEQHGFCRPLDKILLSSETRVELLERVRADRMRRQDRPRASDQHVVRDAIASERIEGVDARRWLHATTTS